MAVPLVLVMVQVAVAAISTRFPRAAPVLLALAAAGGLAPLLRRGGAPQCGVDVKPGRGRWPGVLAVALLQVLWARAPTCGRTVARGRLQAVGSRHPPLPAPRMRTPVVVAPMRMTAKGTTALAPMPMMVVGMMAHCGRPQLPRMRAWWFLALV